MHEPVILSSEVLDELYCDLLKARSLSLVITHLATELGEIEDHKHPWNEGFSDVCEAQTAHLNSLIDKYMPGHIEKRGRMSDLPPAAIVSRTVG